MMNTKNKLFVRSVARALNAYLRSMQADAHWVRVIGEDSLANEPTALWPSDIDPMLNVLIQDGRSEGCIVCIYAQPDRYQPQSMIPLVGLKFLCDKRRVGQYLPHIFDFLDNLQDQPEVIVGKAILPALRLDSVPEATRLDVRDANAPSGEVMR